MSLMGEFKVGKDARVTEVEAMMHMRSPQSVVAITTC